MNRAQRTVLEYTEMSRTANGPSAKVIGGATIPVAVRFAGPCREILRACFAFALPTNAPGGICRGLSHGTHWRGCDHHGSSQRVTPLFAHGCVVAPRAQTSKVADRLLHFAAIDAR